jgi:hypothetical protein
MANVLAVAGPNSKYKLPDAQPAGFWHGIIVPIIFIISIFNPNVRIYETSNRGRLYDFGFILGLTGSIGGSGSRTRLIDIKL